MKANLTQESRIIMSHGHHLWDRLDLKTIKNSLPYDCIYSDPTELMYKSDDELSYFKIYDYGSIVFLGVNKNTQTNIITSIRSLLKLDQHNALITETFGIEVNEWLPYDVLFDKIIIKKFDLDIAQIIMLNLSQSVALDYYVEQSNVLMKQTTQLSIELEEKGKFSIKGNKLQRYIGRVLNIKNKIAENLYIFDGPNLTWNDQFLNTVNNDLSRELDIKMRHKSLQENLSTVRENLEIFQNISQHYHSTLLEWIIIIMIAVEIVNMFIERLF